jgi:hypothetical protein
VENKEAARKGGRIAGEAREKLEKEEDLDRGEGLHAFHGQGKLDRFIRWAYEHVRLHEEDIRKALGKTPADRR